MKPMKKNKRRNTSALAPLTPDFSQPAPTAPAAQPSEADLLRLEIAQLRQRISAQSHCISQLNAQIKFVLETLEAPLKPLKPRQTRRPAKKGKFQ